jgi:hypothetical protein
VHQRPVEQTNSAYKGIYRDLLNFEFQKAITTVKTYINFYEANLIEECLCGQDFFLDIIKK